jgi:hypothetical protein
VPSSYSGMARIRLSLLAGAIIPFLYFGAQGLAAPFFPGFSFWAHTASVLGSDLSTRPAILNAGAALCGAAGLAASYVLCIWLLRRTRVE